jgi:hypothetical protein
MVHPIQHVVVVKLSAWPEAWDDVKAAETVAFFEAVTRALRSSVEGLLSFPNDHPGGAQAAGS